MPFYHKLGKIPPKRHTQFRKADGSLYYEQLFGTIGFDGMSSNSYHEYRPTMVKEIRKQYSIAPKIAKENNLVIIEDAAHAIGAKYRLKNSQDWIKVGSCFHSTISGISRIGW